jgi:hypothetical protein
MMRKLFCIALLVVTVAGGSGVATAIFPLNICTSSADLFREVW